MSQKGGISSLELREASQNLDFQVHQNRRIRWWGVANSESGESPKIRHFRTIKRWNLVREAPISSSAEPAIPARKVRTGPDQPSRPGMSDSVEPGGRKQTSRSADRFGRSRRQNRGPSKCGNLFAEGAKTWISRYLKTGELHRESRDFELPGTGQNLDFQISQNSGTYSRKSLLRAPGNRPKLGFRGTSKQGNTLAGRR